MELCTRLRFLKRRKGESSSRAFCAFIYSIVKY